MCPWFRTWFRAVSGTNLFKQGKIVTGLPCSPIAQYIVRVLAQSVRGPGFESWSGHMLCPPCDTSMKFVVCLIYCFNVQA